MLKVIFFDFDDTILETLELKARAFVRLFHEHPGRAAEIERIHRFNGGWTRFQKFRRIHEDVLGLPFTPDDASRLDGELGQFIREGIAECPFVPGARDFIERHSRQCALYIVSNSPQEELREIVGLRGLARFFRGVFGWPATKAETIASVLSMLKVDPRDAVFIGDTPQDAHAAAAAGVPFIARRTPGTDAHPFPMNTVAIVQDLAELEANWQLVQERLGHRRGDKPVDF